MKFLIVGANFSNKGAQSMLFTTVDEIKKRYPDSKILYGSIDNVPPDRYKFERLYYSDRARNIALNRHKLSSVLYCFMKDCVKTVLRKRNNTWCYLDLSKEIESINCIIDISGFNFGKQWPVSIQETYLDNLRISKKFDIPIIIMPQSFGPFEYSQESQHVINEAMELLPHAKVIFAREAEGYKSLIDTFHLTNVKHSTDLVLQNKGADINNIYVNPPELSVPSINKNAVGIIPNMQCFKYGDKDRILNLYYRIITSLTAAGKHVYVFRHSREDIIACREIYDICNQKITLLENDFSCFEYDYFVRQFDFIICSRYHGNVHAYRNCIPSILLGWAIKYKELAFLLGQDEYSFDITDENLGVETVIHSVEKMCMNYTKESEIIRDRLRLIQKDNCFDVAFGLL